MWGWHGVAAPAPTTCGQESWLTFLEPLFLSVQWEQQHLHHASWWWYDRTHPFPFLKGVLLFQAISPRGTFKNSNSLLIVFLKNASVPHCSYQQCHALDEDLLEPGWDVWFCAKNITRQSFPKSSSDLYFPWFSIADPSHDPGQATELPRTLFCCQ